MGAAARDQAKPSDADLVEAIARGDSSERGVDAARAEAALYARYQRRVYLYGLKHLRDPDAAWDLTQDTLTLVTSKLRERALRDPAQLGSFVLGTCRLLVTGERRTRARRKRLLAQYADPSEAVTAPPTERADLERVARCLGSLSDREQTVLLLSYYAELEASAIARELGTSAGNVRVLRHRAFERLHGCVEGLYAEHKAGGA
jgi:RNA polymerase sigma-70 factor, ECF subfamily